MDLVVQPYERCYGMFHQSANSSMKTSEVYSQHRANREFVPAEKKDDKYWFKRVRNNASARKSRMKRKAMDNVIEKKLLALQNENVQLRNELASINIMYCGSIAKQSIRHQTHQEAVNTDGDYNDDVSDNEIKYEQKNIDHEEENSNFSGKSEMDDGRNDTVSSDDNLSPSFPTFHGIFPPTYAANELSESFHSSSRNLSLPLSYQAMMTFHSAFSPQIMMQKMNNATDKTQPEYSEKNVYEHVHSVPLKIRMKEKLHSAFQNQNLK
ncbi:nuclear factor interleukin-3-regulated protein-like [Mytilus edulis]|uniref:nuclear factor interleukin-3-regulated protein-like n=1 Tax=Mytilus edulis TaxID=6550 RepID=UPI0039EE355A